MPVHELHASRFKLHSHSPGGMTFLVPLTRGPYPCPFPIDPVISLSRGNRYRFAIDRVISGEILVIDQGTSNWAEH